MNYYKANHLWPPSQVKNFASLSSSPIMFPIRIISPPSKSDLLSDTSLCSLVHTRRVHPWTPEWSCYFSFLNFFESVNLATLLPSLFPITCLSKSPGPSSLLIFPQLEIADQTPDAIQPCPLFSLWVEVLSEVYAWGDLPWEEKVRQHEPGNRKVSIEHLEG